MVWYIGQLHSLEYSTGEYLCSQVSAKCIAVCQESEDLSILLILILTKSLHQWIQTLQTPPSFWGRLAFHHGLVTLVDRVPQHVPEQHAQDRVGSQTKESGPNAFIQPQRALGAAHLQETV